MALIGAVFSFTQLSRKAIKSMHGQPYSQSCMHVVQVIYSWLSVCPGKMEASATDHLNSYMQLQLEINNTLNIITQLASYSQLPSYIPVPVVFLDGLGKCMTVQHRYSYILLIIQLASNIVFSLISLYSQYIQLQLCMHIELAIPYQYHRSLTTQLHGIGNCDITKTLLTQLATD